MIVASPQRQRLESLPSLAACLGAMWAYIPATLAAVLTSRMEWMVLIVVAAFVGAGYGKICERRMIRRIVERWIASSRDDPHLRPRHEP